MLKVVKRPKEYIAIKVPEDCEDVGKFVSNKFKENGIPIRVNVRYGYNIVTTFGEGEDQHFVKQGDMLVADYSDPCGYVVHVMSQEKFNKQFMPANQDNKKITVTLDANTEPIKAALNKIKAEMSTKIEGVALPARPGFSESFIAELDKALSNYRRKQEQSSQHTSTPHVRIDIDNIHDTPHVWIDGERVDDMHGDKKPNLSRVYVNWRAGDGADMQSGKHEFVIQHYEQDGKNMPKEIKTGERSITDKDD